LRPLWVAIEVCRRSCRQPPVILGKLSNWHLFALEQLPRPQLPYSGFTDTEIDGEKQKPPRQPDSWVPAGSGFVLINHHMEFVMNKFTSAVKAFVADENGVTAIEYGLMAALIGLVLATGAGLLGQDLSDAFTKIGSTIKTKVGA
jgi:pilus assembly protein Flp/PilA